VSFFDVGTAAVCTGAVVAGAGCAVAGTVVSGGNASKVDGTEVVPQPAATNMTNVEVTVTRRIGVTVIGPCGEVLLLVWFLWDPYLPARLSLCG
jgi:hypothetical protein